MRASAHDRSTATDEENNQRNKTIIEDIPSATPELPPPVPIPDKPAQPPNEPLSVELEGERRMQTNLELGLTSAEADVSGPSTGDEDPRNRPKKPRNASERAREHWKRRTREYSPGRPGEAPDEPGGETAAPGSVHDIQERPKNVRKERADAENSPEPSKPPRDPRSDQEARRPVEGEPGGRKAVEGAGYDGIRPSTHRNERIVETNTLHRDMGPGGHKGEGVESRGVVDDQDRRKVIEGGEYDGERTRTEENERVVETNAQRRDTGPGGQLGERGGLGDVKCDRERQSDGDGVEMDGNRCRMDGATSGASGGSKRLDTRPLAETDSSQHEQRKYKIAHVPQPSIPPPCYARSLSTYVDPPRRRGRLKSRPRNVSHPRWTYQATRTCRGRIRQIERAGYVAYRPEMTGERY